MTKDLNLSVAYLTYKNAFDAAKAHMERCREELGKVNSRKIELEIEVAKLRETVIALGRMFGEQFDEADELGLTDAIRQIFMAQPQTYLTAQNVRDRLEFLGFSLEKYGNALASIHTVIKRLVEKDEIFEYRTGGDKAAYILKQSIGTPIMSSLPELSSVSTPRPTPVLDTTKKKK
jgi:hypothetical protein